MQDSKFSHQLKFKLRPFVLTPCSDVVGYQCFEGPQRWSSMAEMFESNTMCHYNTRDLDWNSSLHLSSLCISKAHLLLSVCVCLPLSSGVCGS